MYQRKEPENDDQIIKITSVVMNKKAATPTKGLPISGAH